MSPMKTLMALICFSAALAVNPADFLAVNDDLKVHVFHPVVLQDSIHRHARRNLAEGEHVTRGYAEDGLHAARLTLEIDVLGEQMLLDLERSDDLLSGGFVHVAFGDSGEPDGVHASSRAQVELCHYHGKVRGDPDSVVTLSTCSGLLHASITKNGQTFGISPHGADPARAASAAELPAHVVFDIHDRDNLPARGCGGHHGGADHSSHHHRGALPAKTLGGSSGLRVVVRGGAGEKGRALGAFDNFRPLGGCSCLSQSWRYNGVTVPGGECGNPDSDPNGAWCFTQNGCGRGGNWEYCEERAAPTKRPTPRPTNAPPAPVTSPTNRPTPRPTNSPPAPAPAPAPAPSGNGRHVELLFVNDFSMFSAACDSARRVGGSATGACSGRSAKLQAAQDRAMMIANEVKERYKALNRGITVTLVAVATFTSSSAESSAGIRTGGSESINAYLDRFTAWRGSNNGEVSFEGSRLDLRNDNAQLLTNTDRSGSTTGLAWVGTMCSGSHSAGVDEDKGLWQYTVETVAHEMGHNFGSAHDSSGNSCDGSRYIMAASGTVSSSFSRAFKTWSSCSASSITAKLQSLENLANNCLANDPRTPVGGAVCGDGIVTAPEECDAGTSGSSLCYGASSDERCTLKAGVQCSSGECCDSSTGRFKASGVLCRSSMHQCDLPDFCSGNSASCETDNLKADGTTCTEGGAGAKCYQGSCLGYDTQCSEAFSGYTGTWVHSCRNGIAASCDSECGELKCTNTAWDNYCQSYNCPSGYRCTVGGLQLQGPATHSYANCMAAPNAVTAILVKDGTPCGGSGTDKICKNRQCINRPPAVGALVAGCSLDCGANGVCAQDNRKKAGSKEVCACQPGWEGARCAKKVQCTKGREKSCAQRNREGCVSTSSCGLCRPAFSSFTKELGPKNECDHVKPKTKAAAVAPHAESGGVVVDVEYEQNFSPRFYTIQSANTHPSQDPKSWVLLGGRADANGTVTFELLDNRTGEAFSARHQTRVFPVKTNAEFARFRFVFSEVRDVHFQLGATIDEELSEVALGGSQVEVTADTTERAPGDLDVAQLQIAEIGIFALASADITPATAPSENASASLAAKDLADAALLFDLDSYSHLVVGMPGFRKDDDGAQEAAALGAGQIAGIAVGAVLGVAVVGAAAFFLFSKATASQPKSKPLRETTIKKFDPAFKGITRENSHALEISQPTDFQMHSLSVRSA